MKRLKSDRVFCQKMLICLFNCVFLFFSSSLTKTRIDMSENERSRPGTEVLKVQNVSGGYCFVFITIVCAHMQPTWH